MSLLQKQDQEALSTDLQAFVHKEEANAKKSTAKQLHSAVHDMTQAEKAMDAAINSKTNLLASWRAFLAASLTAWKEYTEQFQQQEKKCQEEIQAAREALAKATENAKEGFNNKKAKADADTTEVISDDETNKDQMAAPQKESPSGCSHASRGPETLDTPGDQVSFCKPGQ